MTKITEQHKELSGKKERLMIGDRWYARGGGIARSGPYPSWHAAREAMQLVKYPARTQIAGDFRRGAAQLCLVERPAQERDYPEDLFIWPEERSDY
jgi:hypothetical protein